MHVQRRLDHRIQRHSMRNLCSRILLGWEWQLCCLRLGCQQCADGSGICVTCKQGFTQDANDRTKCDAVQSVTSSGTVCPDGSFSNGSTCQPCSPSCSTCSGATSNECIVCGNGQFSLGGSCVPTNGNGVCDGSSMVANNNKHECDSEHFFTIFYCPRLDLIGNKGCPAKCTSCGIPNFNVASTINQLQCAACLPGFVLSNGTCVGSCPSGTFLSPTDNLTCTACSSQCGTCVGAADFCLTCNGGQLASGGKCVSSCPSNTITTAGTCTTCHPDCATCSGTSFNQCSSCSSNRPVLSNGRCLPTCSKTQFFDSASGSCQSCDSTCSSCSVQDQVTALHAQVQAQSSAEDLACQPTATEMIRRARASSPASECVFRSLSRSRKARGHPVQSRFLPSRG
ncbi:insulin-like growth factor binding protein [Russula vinacea]|nr:insulin-like growth factor binding protein [Russula vinacea]